MSAELADGVSDPLIDEVLVGAEALAARIDELGELLSADYAGRDLLLVGVLKGAVFFMADLVRRITVPCEIDFMAVSSYGSSTDSSGVVRILKDLDANIEGRHVVIVEDIVDSGLTLSYLVRNLQARGPASLEVCALLTKPERREANIECRYVGLRDPQPVRHRVRARLRRALSQPPVRRRAERGAAARRASLTTLLQAGPRRADRGNDPDAENARTLGVLAGNWAQNCAWYRSTETDPEPRTGAVRRLAEPLGR